MKQVIFLTVNHRGPLPLRELHSTDDTIDIVWRDPGGSWACLRPVSDYEWIHPFRVAVGDTDTCIDGILCEDKAVLERTEPERKVVKEEPRKGPQKSKKNEPFEKLKSTESLKIEKRTKYIKTALEIAKNETLKDEKAKEQALGKLSP